jgi:hypothetical protein
MARQTPVLFFVFCSAMSAPVAAAQSPDSGARLGSACQRSRLAQSAVSLQDDCSAGRADACRQFQRVLVDGEWPVSPPSPLGSSNTNGGYSTIDLKNVLGTTEDVRSRCDNQDPLACLELGRRHYLGDDAALDVGTAVTLFRKAWINAPAHCDVLAHALTFEASPPSIGAEASRALDLACNSNNGQACMAIALVHDGPQSKDDASGKAHRLDRDCRLGFRESCFSAGVLFGASGIPADVEKSHRYTRRGFDLLFRALGREMRQGAAAGASSAAP